MLRQSLAHRDQVIATILQRHAKAAFHLFCSPFLKIGLDHAQIAPIAGPAECCHLRPRIIDVVFLGNGKPRLAEKIGQRIPHHRAAAMPDMHGPRRIGRDIFDIDAPPSANRAIAIGFAHAQQKRDLPRQIAFLEPQIDESRPRRFGVFHHRQRAELLHQRRGNLGRRQARGLGNHQRGIGRHIAM